MSSLLRRALIITCALVLSKPLLSYPEMVRHGYAHCTACHVSPSGGGLLTPYGRGLSRELLSTWGSEKEAEALYGAVKLPDWLNVGGDFRWAQLYMNNSRVEEARFIWMQADLEVAFKYDKWQLVGTFGRQEGTSFNYTGNMFFSRRHYLQYQPIEKLSIRFGKFQTQYGLMVPEHQTSIRRGLRWDEGSEDYNLEVGWLGDNFDVYATAIFGRPESIQLNRERGVALRGGAFLSERHKLGFGYLYGANDTGKRHVFGPYAIVSIGHPFFVLAEFDLQNTLPNSGDGQWGWVNYLRVNYEILKGWHVYLLQDYSRSDFSRTQTSRHNIGIGTQFFPRPHIELQTVYQKSKADALGDSYFDYFWLMGHFYL